MRRFLILMQGEYDMVELREKLGNKIGATKTVALFWVSDRIVMTGTAKFGFICSLLWQCQKFGEVRCEIAPIRGGYDDEPS